MNLGAALLMFVTCVAAAPGLVVTTLWVRLVEGAARGRRGAPQVAPAEATGGRRRAEELIAANTPRRR